MSNGAVEEDAAWKHQFNPDKDYGPNLKVIKNTDQLKELQTIIRDK